MPIVADATVRTTRQGEQVGEQSIFYSLQTVDARAKGVSIMEFDTMVGVPKAYTGVSNPIRGTNGGGLPWVIGAAEGRLKQSGDLEVSVTGLVLEPNDPGVIARGARVRTQLPVLWRLGFAGLLEAVFFRRYSQVERHSLIIRPRLGQNDRVQA